MSEQKIKITAAVVTALFFISLIFIGVTMKKNSNLKEDMNTERLKSENLLAEKLKLDKQIVQFKKDLTSLEGSNSELNVFLADLKTRLDEKEESFKRLGNENASLRRFRKEAEDLRKMREQLQAHVAQMDSKNTQLSEEIQTLNQTIASLQQQNLGLNNQISEMQLYAANNFKLEVVRRNPDKLTHRARRTHTLLVSFELPKKEGQRNFRLDLQSPTGNNLQGELKVESVLSSSSLSASVEGIAPLSKDKISITFTPEARLSEGTYTLFIFDGHKYINNLQFRLSK